MGHPPELEGRGSFAPVGFGICVGEMRLLQSSGGLPWKESEGQPGDRFADLLKGNEWSGEGLIGIGLLN